MVILEPDGTVAHDTTAAPAYGPLDIVADLLAPDTSTDGGLHYSFDVGGLGTVAVEIERGRSSATGSLPHRFVMYSSGS